jgi:hypothetical protein
MMSAAAHANFPLPLVGEGAEPKGRREAPPEARRVGALSASPAVERAPTPTLARKRERGRTAGAFAIVVTRNS